MGDISEQVPELTKTVAAIYDHYKTTGDAEPMRNYLGISVIGHHCSRYLWYCFRHCCDESFDGRMYRLFETGDLEEFRFVKNLRNIGCTVYEVDGNGNQFAFKGVGGHYAGHMDGCGVNIPEAPETWHVLEFKTHSNKSFNQLKTKGVQKSKPTHYCQMMEYMHYSGMKRALYLAVNKDTDELYSERIRYNAEEAKALTERAEFIINATQPPERITENPDHWQCRFCSAGSICWGTDAPAPAVPVPVLSCRQCIHATPEHDTDYGRWSCAKLKKSLSREDQDRACEHHLFIPGLITFAAPVDAGEGAEGDWIEYENGDKTRWRQGQCKECYRSSELMNLPGPLVGADCTETLKDGLGVTVLKTVPSLPAKYSEDVEIVWQGKPEDMVRAWNMFYDEDLIMLDPVETYDDPEFSAAEYTDNRIAYYPRNLDLNAEIRKGKE